MHKRNSHCSYCGQAFPADQGWPRQCAGCNNISYLNPTPVAVVLLPVEGGLLTIRRSIEPKKGLLALPGGFINYGESWQQGGARELYEETGIRIDPAEIRLFDVLSAPDGTLLVFGLARARTRTELSDFADNEESSECVILSEITELAFPLHTQVVKKYFSHPRDTENT